MDELLSRVTHQAVQYAIRSGITITTSFAIKECGRLLKQAPKGKERQELMQLQLRLESKIRVIAPSIDMIELIAARGNTSLESAVALTKDLRYEMQKLGQRLQNASEDAQLQRTSKKSRDEINHELREIIQQIRTLLDLIEDAVPLINLAITTSGVNLSTKLSGTISPSRLLQASTFLTASDTRYTNDPSNRQQVGPTYVLTLYMLFAGHSSRASDGERVRQATWKEVIHKARIKLWRVPLEQLYDLPGQTSDDVPNGYASTIPAEAKAGEFAYQLVVVEDQDDGRYHDPDEEASRPFDDVSNAGIADVIPCHEISKVFYADRGKILNIGSDDGTNNPVLLLKRDVHAEPPRRMMRRSPSQASIGVESLTNGPRGGHKDQTEINAQIDRQSAPPTPLKGNGREEDRHAWRLPADLDPEWMAFEVYVEDQDEDDSDSPLDDERPAPSWNQSSQSGLMSAFSAMKLRSSPTASPGATRNLVPAEASTLNLSPSKRKGPPIKTSLSLLEMLMKLAALQQFRQESHLAIEDELLNFFLSESSTAGAGADKEFRQRLRRDATKRVGFDPYDESPIKRHSEDYIRHANGGACSPNGSPSAHDLPYDDAYEYDELLLQHPAPQLSLARPSIELHRSREGSPMSPSPPRRPPYQQTPSRSSTPDLPHRNAVQARYPEVRSSPPPSQPLAVPQNSGSKTTRAGTLRSSHSEPMPRSPLGQYNDDNE
ncbi:Hypothetical predicted protein [Lecanosticta acicola]|uniref:Ran-binding-domain-containing protein n=1 Tax=Lecanosticta acicola TaxID=111012 RepID=A0AAI8Z6R2_9PEZI|nr:Hypothetical predicted protein [Lecanosticta acicola]